MTSYIIIILGVCSVLCDALSIFKSISSESGPALLFPFHIGGNSPGE